MNETIKALLEIDRDTEKLKKDTEDLIEKERENAGRVLEDFAAISEKRAKYRAEEAIAKIERENIKTINALKDASDTEIAELEAFFNAEKTDLTESAFRKLWE